MLLHEYSFSRILSVCSRKVQALIEDYTRAAESQLKSVIEETILDTVKANVLARQMLVFLAGRNGPTNQNEQENII